MNKDCDFSWLFTVFAPLDAHEFEMMWQLETTSAGWDDDVLVLPPEDAGILKMEFDFIVDHHLFDRHDLYPFHQQPSMDELYRWLEICECALKLNQPILAAYGL